MTLMVSEPTYVLFLKCQTDLPVHLGKVTRPGNPFNPKTEFTD